jgi:ABC-type Na+ efflux pump permease subunit
LPAVFATLPRLISALDSSPAASISAEREIDDLLRRMPPSLRAELASYTIEQQLVILMTVYYLAPLYLILPLLVASVIAADGVAGEKERKTLEALLYTPITDSELLLAKLLAAWIPAVLVAWGGFVIYTLVVNVAAWPTMGRIFFPNTMWWYMALWMAPAIAGLGLSFTVLISARVGSFQEAYQLGSIIVIPIIALIAGQATGALYFGARVVFLMGAAFWVVDLTLIYFGAKLIRRPQLAMRL